MNRPVRIDSDQLKEHLRFAAELGVAGVSRDSAWREKGDGSIFGGDKEPAEDAANLREKGDGSHFPAKMFRESEESGATVELSENTPVPILPLTAVREDIGDCTRCKLHTLGRTQIVFGVGNPAADLMFVGEAPGADEDIQGIPFVGRAGQLLTKIIEAIGLTREDVYIANVIKCRPPQNRNPEPDEVQSCEPFLFRQIDIIKPRVIVALGKFAAQTLLRTEDPISRLRGRVFDYRGAKLIPTFHPAYLLRNPGAKREVWEDMKLVRSLLQQ